MGWGILSLKSSCTRCTFSGYNFNAHLRYKLSSFTPEEIIGKSLSLQGVLEPFSSNGNIDLLKRAGFVDFVTVFRNLCFEGVLALKWLTISHRFLNILKSINFWLPLPVFMDMTLTLLSSCVIVKSVAHENFWTRPAVDIGQGQLAAIPYSACCKVQVMQNPTFAPLFFSEFYKLQYHHQRKISARNIEYSHWWWLI